MKELEVFLRQVPRPKVSAPRFKQELKRRLLNSSRFARGRFWKIAFVGALTTQAALLGILVAFVIYPTYPVRLHEWLAGSTEQQGLAYEGEQSNVNDRLGKANDQLLVNDYLTRKYRSGSVKVRPLTGEEMVSIRRFELDNGKQILVYTKHNDTATLPVVY